MLATYKEKKKAIKKVQKRDAEFKAAERDMPDSVNDSIAMAEQLEAEALLIFTTNPDALKTYQERETRLTAIEKDLASSRGKLRTISSQPECGSLRRGCRESRPWLGPCLGGSPVSLLPLA